VIRDALGFREILESIYKTTRFHTPDNRNLVDHRCEVSFKVFKIGRGEGIRMIVVFRLRITECVKKKKFESSKETSFLYAKFRLNGGKYPVLMCKVPSHLKRMP
jgi:hypothetical protein